MSKKTILWIILDLIFLVVFNTVFFTLSGLHHPASVWISYVLIHLAYLMVIITPALIRKSSNAAVFGFSLYSISSTYFLCEFVVGILFIILKSESIKAAVVVQIILAGIYGILLVSHMIANENTADNVNLHEEEVALIKEASSRVRALVGQAADKRANKEIERAYDMIHSSPSKSNQAVHSLESAVMNKISDLENAIRTGETDKIVEISRDIISTMDERNRRLRLSN